MISQLATNTFFEEDTSAMADAGEKIPVQETGVPAATAGEPSQLERSAPPSASHQKKTGYVVYQHLWISHGISSTLLLKR